MISYFVNTLAYVVFVLFHWYDYPCLPTAKAIWPVHASSQVQAIGYRETYSNSGKRHWLNITKTKKWLYICWYLLQHSFLVRCQIKKFYESLHCFRQQYHCMGVCVCMCACVCERRSGNTMRNLSSRTQPRWRWKTLRHWRARLHQRSGKTCVEFGITYDTIAYVVMSGYLRALKSWLIKPA